MNVGQRLAPLQSILALALLVVWLTLANDKFLTVDNSLNVLRQISINLCLSLGMTLVILSGGIDLSVGSVLALAGAVAAGLMKSGIDVQLLGLHIEFTFAGAIVAGVCVGAAAGGFNGLAITRFGLPPFIATLGMLSIARGLTLLWTGGHPITGLGEQFAFLGTGRALGVPIPIWVAAFLAILAAIATRRTKFGRHLYAVGGSERAAQLSGVNVQRVKFLAYTLCGGLAGVAGLLMTARVNSATPNAGVADELDAIAAVVIGGASLSGGRGSISGTVMGCLIIGVLNNGLALENVSPYWQQVIKGAVILAAVAIDRLSRRSQLG